MSQGGQKSMNRIDKYLAIRIYEMDEQPQVRDIDGHMMVLELTDLTHILVYRDAWSDFSKHMRAALAEGDSIVDAITDEQQASNG